MRLAFRTNRFRCVHLLLLAIAFLSGCSAERAEQADRGVDRGVDRSPEDQQPFDDDHADEVPMAIEGAEMPDALAAPMMAQERVAEASMAAPDVNEIVTVEPMLAAPSHRPPPVQRAPERERSFTQTPRHDTEFAMEAGAPSAAGETAAGDAAEDPTQDPARQPASTGPFATLPAGAKHDAENGYATVAVFYATDRRRDSVPMSAYNITGNRDAFVLLGGCAAVFFVFALANLLRKRSRVGLAFGILGGVSAAGATIVLISGSARIEKRGVTYNADRGSLVKGICEVTVPDRHDRGVVERPSLLRFEIREDQKEHIVLTSAIELSGDDFQQRLSDTIALSPDEDLLVFIHGYNVDFETAVRRTAQIAVDLPFEGVPVCYSWPSQGTLFGYTVDETNAAWTQTHLKQFLLELAGQSGARSINVVAHSMGNRPTTGAMYEIGWERRDDKLFDRVVLAAPDVDADRFRRDLAPALSGVANHVTLYASSDDRALIASKQVHGYARAGESGDGIVVVPGIETIDVSGIDLSLLGHSYYGDSGSMLQDLFQVVRHRLPANERRQLMARPFGDLTYWQLVEQPGRPQRFTAQPNSVR